MTRYLGALSRLAHRRRPGSAGLALGLALAAAMGGLGGCAWLGQGDEPSRQPSPTAPAPEDIAAAKARWAEEALPTLDLTRYEAMRLYFAQDPDAPPALDDAALCRLGALVMEELDRLAPNRPPLADKLAPGQSAYDATVLCERAQIESGHADGNHRADPPGRPRRQTAPAGRAGEPVPEAADRRPNGQDDAPEKTVLRATITLADAASGQSLAIFRVEKDLEPGEAGRIGPTPTEAWRRFARGMAAAVLGQPSLAGLPAGRAAGAP